MSRFDMLYNAIVLIINVCAISFLSVGGEMSGFLIRIIIFMTGISLGNTIYCLFLKNPVEKFFRGK